MAQLKDTTITGDLSVSGTVNSRNIAADGEKLDTLYPTIYRVQHDVAKSILDVTLIPQSSTPRFRWIRSMLSTVLEVDYNYIPTGINLTYYNTSGELGTISFDIGNSYGVKGVQQNMEVYADLSHGPIKITSNNIENPDKTHVYLLTVEIL